MPIRPAIGREPGLQKLAIGSSRQGVFRKPRTTSVTGAGALPCGSVAGAVGWRERAYPFTTQDHLALLGLYAPENMVFPLTPGARPMVA